MLKSKYNLSWSSQTMHPYQSRIEQVQDKILLAISVGLLKRLTKNSEGIVSEKLSSIFNGNLVWNNIKELKGFTRNERHITDPLVESTRRLLLFRKFISHISTISTPFTESDFVKEILDPIPDETTSVLLEELLDNFMEKERSRFSPEEDNPLLNQIEETKTIEEDFPESSKTTNDEDYLADRVDDEIQFIQQSKNLNSIDSISNTKNQSYSNEGTKTIDGELRKYIHSILQNLHSQSKKITVLTQEYKEYIDKLENHQQIQLYINRPAYKLALRIRNNLVFN